MTSPNPPECRICKLPLARSALSHQNECPFCGRTFRRVDGAKRHTKTCHSRGNRRLPPDAKRGRKVHACDACSRVKVSCDSKFPCSRCASRALTCTYLRLCTDPSHLATSLPDTTPPPRDNRLALSFLLACTDPAVGPVDEVILAREPGHDTDQPVAGQSPNHHGAVTDTIDPRLLFLNFIDPSFDVPLDWQCINEEYIPELLPQLDLSSPDEALQAHISLLQAHIQQVAVLDPNVQNGFNIGSSTAFFTTASFHECIQIFFQRKQLLATIIHRPTFHLRVDPALLLAIAVSGFSYLHYRKRNTENGLLALVLRGMAEKYIFHRVEQLLRSTGCTGDSQQTLEICQAAYMMATLQSCVKDRKIRQNLVTKCHPMLVNLLRSRGIVGTGHGSPQPDHDWHMFIYKESCIRLLHWLFINDAWFTLLFNHPPAMTFLDMSGQLPCADELWNADSPQKFESIRLLRDLGSDSSCLKLLMSRLLGDEWMESTEGLYTRLNVDHFLVIVLAFQHVIFHYHASVLGENSSSIVLRGLDRWNRLWQDAMGRMNTGKRESLGLEKYSTELATLTRRIVEASSAKEDAQSEYLNRIITYDTVALYRFIKQCTE